MVRFAQIAALALAVLAGQATAETEIPVDVELVLAVDVSRSMSPGELEIQRRGYVEALLSDEVLGAIADGIHGQVAITYVEWAGTGSQRIVADWTLIRDRADAEAFVAVLTANFDPALRRTSISGAIDFAAGLFDENGFEGLGRVIDISGDGPNNQGRPVTDARDAAVAAGITINGLPLMTREGMGYQWHLPDLDRYYRDCVVGGPSAFVIPVLEWEHFPAAVRQKLVLELVHRPPAPEERLPVRRVSERPYDCRIGEKIWRDMMGDWN